MLCFVRTLITNPECIALNIRSLQRSRSSMSNDICSTSLLMFCAYKTKYVNNYENNIDRITI